MLRFYLYIFVFCLLDISLSKAQLHYFGSPAITNFSRNDYQAGTQNWSIAQDQKGIMYFGNNKGLLEFDGTNWELFFLPNHTIVRSFTFGENSQLYIGGQDELGYLTADEKGRKSYTSLTHLIPDELKSFEDVWKIFALPESVLFCTEKALFKLESGQIDAITPKKGRFENFFNIDNQVYVQHKENGLFRLKNDKLIPVPGGDIFVDERIVALLPYEKNQLIIFTVSRGIYLMDSSGIRPWKAKASEFLMTNQAYCAIELKNGQYAIGTSQEGLLIMDRNGNPVMRLNQETGLQNNTILSVCQDIQQNLWLALDNGIDYAEINAPFSIIRPETGVEGTGYAAIIHEEKLFLGTNQGMFFTNWNDSKSSIDPVKFTQVDNTLGQVWSINQLDDKVLVNQHNGSGFLDDTQVKPFSNIQGAWKFMKLETQPDYAIEGTYAGLFLYKNLGSAQNSNWKLVTKLEGFDESARVFEEDDEGNIWVSHAYKGLFKIELSQDLEAIEKISFYNSEYGLPDDLFINVSKVRNELIFSTPHGIYTYDQANDRFVAHPEFNKIFGENRNFHRLLEDELGNIWFSVDNEFGVLKIKEEGVFNKFEISYFNQIYEELVDGFEHIYAYDNSNIFVGTEKGFIHFNPSRNTNSHFPFHVLIRKVTSITEGDSIIFWGNHLDETSEEVHNFNSKKNDFRFSYSAPYYERIDYVQYRFKLEGFVNEWSDWSPKTEKEYTNLAAGDYTFSVQARNAYGQESSQANFSFTILSPWYLSWYAKIAYLFLSIALIGGLVKFISKREKKKTEAFKIEQNKKLEIKEAEVKKSEGEIIKLKNEKLQSDIKHKNSQLASSTMHLVQKSEILMKIKNDLDSLSKEATPEIKRKIVQITRTIESDIRLDNNWEQFEIYFDQVHENFFKRLRSKYPELTPKDQKLCAYLRMNLTTKEIAPLLNISVRGVEISRYRLRKKLALESEENLVAFMMNI